MTMHLKNDSQAEPNTGGPRFTIGITNSAARQFFDNVGPELAGERGARLSCDRNDGYAFREAAESALNRVCDGARCHIELKERSGSHGDPIYSIFVWSPMVPDGWILVDVAGSNQKTVALGIRHWRHAPRNTAAEWPGSIRFSTEHFRVTPIPRQLRESCLAGKSVREFKDDVRQTIAVWAAHLELEERAVEEKAFDLRYNARRPASREGHYRLSVAGNGEKAWALLRPEMLLEISREDSGGRGGRGARTRVKVERIDARSETVVISVENVSPRHLDRIDDWFPRAGHLRSEDWGTRINIQRQRNAIKSLESGRASLPALADLLYGQGDLHLPAGPSPLPIPIGECLVPERTNEEQRLAVAMALGTPDCFLLQGPPGTGKTTFIAELCFQAARRGQRVLVSSQTNLAVDNALSRLQNRPEILAVRLGPSEKIEEEGQAFVEDNAIRRWLSGVSAGARSSIERLAALETLDQRMGEHDAEIVSWLKRGCVLPGNVSAVDHAELRASLRAARRRRDEFSTALALEARLRLLLRKRDSLGLRLFDLETEVARWDGLHRLNPHDLQGLPDPVIKCLARLEKLRRSCGDTSSSHQITRGELKPLIERWMLEELDGAPELADRLVTSIEGIFTRWRRLRQWPLIGLWAARRQRRDRAVVEEAILRVEEVILGRSPVPCRLARMIRNEEHGRRRELAVCRVKMDEVLTECADATDELRIALDVPRSDQAAPENLIELVSAKARLLSAEVDLAVDSLAAVIWREAAFTLGDESGRPSPASVRALRADLTAEVGNRDRVAKARRLLSEWASSITESDAVLDDQLRNAFASGVNVVGATCSFAGSGDLARRGFESFDFVIIDEVSKATATELLMPAILGKKLVLVGDHKQLDPVIGSAAEGESHMEILAELGLDESRYKALLERPLFEDRFIRFSATPEVRRSMTLPRQYRMHSSIMNGINQFYEGQLRPGHDDLDQQRRHDIDEIAWLDPESAVVWVDTPEEPAWRMTPEPGSKSKRNLLEAELVADLTEQLIGPVARRGLTMGVINMYAGQDRRVRDLVGARKLCQEAVRASELKISTVDRFQGMERDVVIVSLCANGLPPSTFLRKPNRVNVAMSRARRLLIVVGSSRTFMRYLGEYSHYGVFKHEAKACGGYRNASEILAHRN